MFKKLLGGVMSEFTPEMLLTDLVRDRCISSMSDLPSFLLNEAKITKTAAVLVPLCVVGGEVALLYTLRSSNLKSHSGQVSFPGGMTDEGETETETALRETEEELGISPSSIEVWSRMPAVQGRNKELLIYPVVGVIKDFHTDKLRPNTREVEEVFTSPLRLLCDQTMHGYLDFEKQMLPVYIHGKHKIWGITGFITHIFLQHFLPEHLYNTDFSQRRFTMDDLMPSSSKL